jgi:hypothetical protein
MPDPALRPPILRSRAEEPRASTPGERSALFERLAAALLAQGDVREVLRAQLEGALETSDRMAEKVIEESRTTYASATRLSELVDESSQRAGAVFERVLSAIESADMIERQGLEERARALAVASQNSRKTVVEQKRLEAIGDTAHGIGMRIRIVAMNTTIEATRSAGATGATINVLAREIAELAVEVQRLGLELSHSLHSMGIHLNRDLVEGIQAEAVALEGVRKTLAAQVQELRASYQELDVFQKAVWREVTTAAKEISAVASALGSLQYQDVVRQRLAQVVGVLVTLAERDEVLKRALRGEQPLPDDWRPLAAEELSGAYVMGAQRAAHAKELGASAPGAPAALPDIDLF